MGLFDSFRAYPAPTLYGENRSAVSADIVEAALATAILIIFFSFLVILPVLQNRVAMLIRASVALFVSAVILVCNFGYGWSVATVHTLTPYKQFTSQEINATIGLHIGLQGFNVTLKGTPTVQRFAGHDESIDYNEHFTWGILQGRLGFGTQAGLVNQEFRAAQYRGAPLPVQWVAEYFTLDGEELRWGRNHRQAGYFTSLLMWCAFAFWMMTLGLYGSSLPYILSGQLLTGTTLIVASVVYAIVHQESGPELRIPFEGGTMELEFGWCFGLVLGTGLACVLGSTIVWIFYLSNPLQVSHFLGLSIVDESDVVFQPDQPVDQSTVFANFQTEKAKEKVYPAPMALQAVPRSMSARRPLTSRSRSFLNRVNMSEHRRPRRSERSIDTDALPEQSPKTPIMLVNDVAVAGTLRTDRPASLVIQNGLTSPNVGRMFFPSRSPSPINRARSPPSKSSSLPSPRVSPRSGSLSSELGMTLPNLRNRQQTPKSGEYHELKVFDFDPPVPEEES